MSDDAEAVPPPEVVPPKPDSRLRRILRSITNWLHRHVFAFGILLLVALFAFIYALPLMLYSVESGKVGVRWSRFYGGTDTRHVLGEGLHIIPPWDIIYKYDARLQRDEREFKVESIDGLAMTVRVAWRYVLVPANAGYLHKYVGPDYSTTLLAPDIAERAREVMADYRPEEIWSTRRSEIERLILLSARENLRDRFKPVGQDYIDFVVLEDVLITNIDLPPGLEEAMVRKQEANQQQQEMDYRLQAERKEAERKRIEALGIREFQDVVSYGLTDSYLRWRGIEATTELAKSPNAKIVVIGNPGGGGLPLILDGFKSSPDATAVPPPALPPEPVTPDQSKTPEIPHDVPPAKPDMPPPIQTGPHDPP